MKQPILVACSHGTNNVTGQQLINQLREMVAALRPGLTVLEAYVDVQEPSLDTVLRDVAPELDAVVVPLLLSVGFHVRVDIANAVAARNSQRAGSTVAAEPLGPDGELAAVLAERLRDVPGDWPVVLAAAGSSDPAAADAVEEVAAELRALRPGTVVAGYGASTTPTVPDAVAQLHDQGHASVAVASYLLAPGYFHDQLAKSGATVVTEPLLPSQQVASLALRRFNEAVARQ